MYCSTLKLKTGLVEALRAAAKRRRKDIDRGSRYLEVFQRDPPASMPPGRGTSNVKRPTRDSFFLCRPEEFLYQKACLSNELIAIAFPAFATSRRRSRSIGDELCLHGRSNLPRECVPIRGDGSRVVRNCTTVFLSIVLFTAGYGTRSFFELHGIVPEKRRIETFSIVVRYCLACPWL